MPRRSRIDYVATSVNLLALSSWFRGVTVSTQDSESCDPSSNLGGTWHFSYGYVFPSTRDIIILFY